MGERGPSKCYCVSPDSEINRVLGDTVLSLASEVNRAPVICTSFLQLCWKILRGSILFISANLCEKKVLFYWKNLIAICNHLSVTFRFLLCKTISELWLFLGCYQYHMLQVVQTLIMSTSCIFACLVSQVEKYWYEPTCSFVFIFRIVRQHISSR